LPWGQEYHNRYENKSIIIVKYNTNHSTSYHPNHSAPDTTGQTSNTTAKSPADYVGAPHTTQQQQHASSRENEEHTQNYNNN
jgi:hypothetical protein